MGKQQNDPYRVRTSTAPSRGGTGRRAMRNMRRWRARHPRELSEVDPSGSPEEYGARLIACMERVEPW